MACGTPVVTCTDSGGPTELITHGVNGLVTEPDPGGARRRARRRWPPSPARARRMGRAGRHRALDITWASTVATDPRLAVDRPAPAEPVIDLTEAASGRRPRPRPCPPGRPARRSSCSPPSRSTSPRHGGQLRCAHLYGRWPATSTSRCSASSSTTTRPAPAMLGPGFWEQAVARSRRARRDRPPHVAHAGLPVTDIVAGTEIARSPAYLAALRRRARRRRARAPGRALPPARARGGRRRRALDLRRLQRRGRPQGRRPPAQRPRPAAPRRRSPPSRAGRSTGAAARHHLLHRGRPRARLPLRPPARRLHRRARTAPTARARSRAPRSATTGATAGWPSGPAPTGRRVRARAARRVLRQLAPTEPRPRPGSSCGWPRSSPRCSSCWAAPTATPSRPTRCPTTSCSPGRSSSGSSAPSSPRPTWPSTRCCTARAPT